MVNQRITKRDEYGIAHLTDDCYTSGGFVNIEKVKERIAEFEDKLESGLLLELPCKVGETVFYETWINNGCTSIGMQGHEVQGYEVRLVVKNILDDDSTKIPISDFGNKFFLDKSKAEARLQELQGENQ